MPTPAQTQGQIGVFFFCTFSETRSKKNKRTQLLGAAFETIPVEKETLQTTEDDVGDDEGSLLPDKWRKNT